MKTVAVHQNVDVWDTDNQLYDYGTRGKNINGIYAQEIISCTKLLQIGFEKIQGFQTFNNQQVELIGWCWLT